MKLLKIILVLLLISQLALGQTPIESKIQSIEVYTQGAEINRSADLKLKKGKNEFKFHSLSSDLDPKTIQIDGLGFTILSVRHEIDFIGNENGSERTATLLIRKHLLLDSIKKIELSLGILEKESTLLNQNQKIIGDQGIQNQDFRSAVAYFSERFRSLAISEFDLKDRKESLEEELRKVNLQIDSFASQQKKPSSNILVSINSDDNKIVAINLSYAVSEAGWFPSYDIRAVNTTEELSITYKARVYQNTGVDWKGIKLRIASGDLESSGTAPELNPYYLGGNNFFPNRNGNGQLLQVEGRVLSSDDGLPLPQVTVMVKGTTLGVPTDENGYYNIQLPNKSSVLTFRFLGYVTEEIYVDQPMINVALQPDITSLDEVVVMGYGGDPYSNNRLAGKANGITIRGLSSPKKERKSQPIPVNYINYQTNFVYDIQLPYDIASNGKPEVVDILTKKVKVEYTYSSTPKIRESAYLVAMIKDWTNLKLLDGESNLYFQNRFVGKSIIDTNIGSDTLNISLGKDEGVVIKRERLKDFKEKVTFSNKKREHRDFKITIVNTKSIELKILVHDQIPLAATDDFKVSIEEISEGELDKETGLLTWRMNLKPGEKKELRIKYSVEYPKNLNIDIK
jgi:hypothetical protein